MFMGESNKKKNTPTKVTEAANQISQTMHAEDGTSITTKRVLGTRRKKTCAQETGERKPLKRNRCSARVRWRLFQWITTIPIESAPIYAPVVVFCQSFGGDLTGHTTLRKGYVGISIQRAIRTYLMLWYARVADSLDL